MTKPGKTFHHFPVLTGNASCVADFWPTGWGFEVSLRGYAENRNNPTVAQSFSISQFLTLRLCMTLVAPQCALFVGLPVRSQDVCYALWKVERSLTQTVEHVRTAYYTFCPRCVTCLYIYMHTYTYIYIECVQFNVAARRHEAPVKRVHVRV